MEYVRQVDFNAFNASPERVSQALLDQDSGAATCTINCIKTPAGGGSPAGLHTHAVDQVFYVLSGSMGVEIKGQEYEAGPGTLVVFPEGVPHRNWVVGSEPTVHLAIQSPLPDPNVTFAKPAVAAAGTR